MKANMNNYVALIVLVVLALFTCTPSAHAQVPTAGRFDFAKRTTVSIGAQREFYQATDTVILGQSDAPQWTAGIFGAFRLGTKASVVASETRGLDLHDWRTTVGLRLTLWRGAKTPLDLPGGAQ